MDIPVLLLEVVFCTFVIQYFNHLARYHILTCWVFFLLRLHFNLFFLCCFLVASQSLIWIETWLKNSSGTSVLAVNYVTQDHEQLVWSSSDLFPHRQPPCLFMKDFNDLACLNLFYWIKGCKRWMFLVIWLDSSWNMTGHAEVFVQALERLEKSPLDGAEQSH